MCFVYPCTNHRQNNLQFQQQQDLLAQQASRRASDSQLRTSQASLATALRAAFDALATAPPATTLSADLQALTGTLAQTAQALGSLPTAPGDLQVKLEDVASGSLWDASRYINATLLPSVDLRGGFVTNMGAGNIKATPPIAFSTAMWALTLLVSDDHQDSIIFIIIVHPYRHSHAPSPCSWTAAPESSPMLRCGLPCARALST